MNKKALCVGLNLYPPLKKSGRSMNLKGCVNDAQRWAGLLTERFDFAKSDVEVILDEKATKEAVMNGLKNMLARAKAEDRLVYLFSGHGTYYRKEVDGQTGYDQAQCTYDWEENILMDNELRELFLNLPQGVRLTVISDSCHSGSVTRMGKEEMATPRLFSGPLTDDPLMPLDGVQTPRHISPEWFGGDELTETEFKAINHEAEQSSWSHSAFDMPQNEMRDVLLSGCNQLELSREAGFNEGFHGALTFYAINAIKQADYRISYAALHKQVRKWLIKYKFKQNPQLEGNPENKERLMFV